MRNKALPFLLLTALGLGSSLGGCTVSVSAQATTKRILEGGDTIVVTAKPPAPEAEKKPEVEKKEKPAVSVAKPKQPLKARRVGKKIEITEKVMFDFDKATIKVDSDQLLKDVATVVRENPTISHLRIEGHTDNVGKPAYNKKLSQQRADAVKEFLTSVGIDGSRLEAVGYGSERPIADNGTEEGREANRRVEFNIVKEDKP